MSTTLDNESNTTNTMREPPFRNADETDSPSLSHRQPPAPTKATLLAGNLDEARPDDGSPTTGAGMDGARALRLLRGPNGDGSLAAAIAPRPAGFSIENHCRHHEGPQGGPAAAHRTARLATRPPSRAGPRFLRGPISRRPSRRGGTGIQRRFRAPANRERRKPNGSDRPRHGWRRIPKAPDCESASSTQPCRYVTNSPPSGMFADCHVRLDGSRAPRKGTDAAVGLYVQPNNTHTTPGQPQSPLPSPDELPRSPSTSATGNTRQLRERARPATPNANELPGSSTTVATSNAPSRKRARPSTTAAADADRDAKRRNVLPEANRADNGATEEETPAALARRLCTERGLSSKTDPWVPIPCFLCEERRAAAKAAGEKVKAAKPKPWKKWSSLRRHVRGCVVADMKHKWPVCHFCKKPIRASGRPDQMARHLAGDGGYRACKPRLASVEEPPY
ncbi:hypothetical protein AURDEDRAFT_115276 [Auricularia subglabra TFB-10046 SS5]|nr:hypothetical protein AURDEDRAFT_115276 [Auricularia subglabra TFB-10046 SS5]